MNSALKIGIGLRNQHIHDVLATKPDIDWLEIHSENYFLPALVDVDVLKEIRTHYALSMHGIGLSLGSVTEPDPRHMHNLKSLHSQINPFLVSEHLSWSVGGGHFVPDLLPLPYTHEALGIFVRNLGIAQDVIGRQILIENPTSYLTYETADTSEVDFLVAVCCQSDAKLLLDVNNVFVSCTNHGWNADEYLAAIPSDMVGEIHIAGHTRHTLSDGRGVLIDTHSTHPCPEVWDLYGKAIKRFGNVPSLLEWDNDIPPLPELLETATTMRAYETS